MSGNHAVIIMGDANLCTLRWDSPTFKYKRIAEELRETLTQCGLIQVELADRLAEDTSRSLYIMGFLAVAAIRQHSHDRS